MAYISLYRKYRSQSFGDLVGQDHVVRVLQSSITSGRIAHAYLFTGPRGTGKTSTARLLAKALCCEQGPTTEPCNECEICTSITAGNFIDVFEMDAASESGVDDVRDAIVNVTEYKPAIARYKVFIIDEVHDLSSKAFDALLKTVEEPPSHIIFVLATTEFNKVPPTIRSRCQKFEFHRGTMADLVNRLSYVAEAEGISIDPAALVAIARMADGGYRDALTLLEQAVLTSDGQVTLQHIYDQLGLIPEEAVDKLLLAMTAGEVKQIMELLTEIARLGRDPRMVLESMLYRLADLTRTAYGLESGFVIDAGREALDHETAAKIGRQRLLSMRSALAEAHKEIRDITLPRIWLEAELVRIASVLLENPAAETKPQQSAPVKEPQRVVPQKEVAERAEAAVASPPPREQSAAATSRAPRETARVAESKPAAVQPDDTDQVRPTNGHQSPEAQIWTKAVQELPPDTPIAKKLGGSKLVSFADGQATVMLRRKMERDWMTDDPKRTGYIVNIIKKLSGQTWSITYVVGESSPVSQEPAAVELPAEGERLVELTKEVFGS